MRHHTNLSLVMLLGLSLLLGCERGSQPRDEQTASVSESPTQPAATPLTVSSSANPTGAGIDADKRARLLGILGGFEHQPSAEELYAIEPAHDALRGLLLDIYGDASVKKGSRQRALGLLHHAHGEATEVFYQRLLSAPDTSDADRRIALRAYATLAPERAEPALIALLDHADAQTRAIAALELGVIGSPGAQRALRARAQVETQPHVRSRIGEALKEDIGPYQAPTSNDSEVK